MTMFKCVDCEELHEDEALNVETVHDPFCTGDYWYTEKLVTCPNCNGDFIEEVWMCSTCGEEEVEKGYDDCKVCLEKLDNE